jgi:flavoprotein
VKIIKQIHRRHDSTVTLLCQFCGAVVRDYPVLSQADADDVGRLECEGCGCSGVRPGAVDWSSNKRRRETA